MKARIAFIAAVFLLFWTGNTQASHEPGHLVEVTTNIQGYVSPPEYHFFKGYSLGTRTKVLSPGTVVWIQEIKEVGYPWYKEKWYFVGIPKTNERVWVFAGPAKEELPVFKDISDRSE